VLARVDPQSASLHDGRVIALDTHRQALRTAMPWLVLALGPLIVSVAAPALAGAFWNAEAEPQWIERACSTLGLVGSAAMLLGLMQLARARVSGQWHPSLALAFSFWLVEFVARLWPMSADGDAPSAWVGARLVASSASMWCLSTGVSWILRHQQATHSVAAWRRVRSAFALLTLALAVVALLARQSDPSVGLSGWLASIPFASAVAWIVFAAPWALLLAAVRATLRWLGRVRSTAEILAR